MWPEVRTIRCRGGERLPLLVSAQGRPLWSHAVYVTTELRARGLSLNSMRTHMRAIRHFEIFCVENGIELGSRLKGGSVLTPAEIENLAATCRIRSADFAENGERGPNVKVLRRGGAAPKEGLRFTGRDRRRSAGIVATGVANTRLHAIRCFIDWRTRLVLAGGIDTETRRRLETERTRTLETLKARMGKREGENADGPEGLTRAEQERLLAVTDPDAIENPWRAGHARIRNSLIIRWLLALGLRRGELLGVQVRDVDFQRGRVTIVRRPDNDDDPRSDPPLVKTRERILEVEAELLRRTRDYVMGHRRAEAGARYHEYLWVAAGTGKPLTLVALQKVFETLKEKPVGLPARLTPHVLRHTWNERFSERMDERGVDEATERRWRCYLMGWADNSQMASVYTRRHIRRRAARAHMQLQRETLAIGSNASG